MQADRNLDRPGTGEMGHVMDRNIRALIERRKHENQARRASEKIADTITSFAGNMIFVYLHLVIFGLWIVINLGWIPGVRKFDPSFVVLAMAASVEAIFLSTFVLITQNRLAALTEKRAELDLQISLLAEHEVTRLFALVTQIANKVGIDASKDPELQELLQDVQPEKVLDKIESATASRPK